METKKHKKGIFKKILIGFFVFILGLILLYFLIPEKTRKHGLPTQYGVTFSSVYAEELGLDWQEVLSASLDDLGIKKYRIPVYWSEVEPEQGKYDFSRLDWQLAEIAKRGGSVHLVVGQRVPRWPECFIPDWALNLSPEQREEALLDHIKRVVTRYKGNPIIEYWQVENEPLLKTFGQCPAMSTDFLKQEINLVKSLDNRKVVITESGELSTWVRGAKYADVLGVSVYRKIFDKRLGYLYYPLGYKHYQKKAWLIQPLVDDIIVTELQLEPWLTQPIISMPFADQIKILDPELFEYTLNFSQEINFSETFLWGVEWWYWLKTEQGFGAYWDEVRQAVNQ